MRQLVAEAVHLDEVRAARLGRRRAA
jgi:hypothetical protein